MYTSVKSLAGKRVFVGLSGGVDSAVSAALLQKAGAKVTGVFIKGWYPPNMPCTWAEDRRDAMRVAAHLKIPFRTLDASQEYKKGVIDYLLAEYRAGRTPNPDIMCNRDVKFGAFFSYAKAQGADAIATGHYARKGAHGELLRASDTSKDQSYFLWAIPQEALAMTMFPVGGMQKSQVRTLAARFKLPVARKKDSQGICFLGSVSVEEFLRAEFGNAPGEVRDTSGATVGMHDGVQLYTIGERLGLSGGPWYIVAKNIEENLLVVGKKTHEQTGETHISFSSAAWFGKPESVRYAQYRYHGPRIEGSVTDSTFLPETILPESVAAGQSIVFYAGDELLGGGIIER